MTSAGHDRGGSTTVIGPVLVCGEALVDLVPEDATATAWRALPGGSPFNTAVALARLGMPTEYVGRLSDDAFGAAMRRHLSEAGVGDRFTVATHDPSTMAVVSFDERGDASYTFYWAGTTNAGWTRSQLPDLRDAPRPSVLHIGSLAAVLPPTSVLFEWFGTHAGSVPISVDLNVRPAVLPEPSAYVEAISPWLSVASVAKASDEDLDFLYPGRPPVEVAAGWLAGNPRLELVVVTLGSDGVLALPRGSTEPVRTPSFPIEVVDTVGAGDTFMAGFLHGCYGLALDTIAAMRRGAAGAAIVCTRDGADPPTTAEVDELLAESGSTSAASSVPGR